jgi:putative acetyltransferase
MNRSNQPAIQSENQDLIGPIREILLAAFPSADESTIVDDLRAAKALAISLVAIEGGRVVGHIAFSPVLIKPEPPAPLMVMALAPLAVAPDEQRRGIGSALVQAGLKACAKAGCDGVVVLGDPGYYRRFGFVPAAERGLRCLFDAPPEAFMIWEADRGRCRSSRRPFIFMSLSTDSWDRAVRLSRERSVRSSRCPRV